MENGLAEPALDEWLDQAEARVAALGRAFAGAIAPVLQTLTPEQVDELRDASRQRHAKAMDEYAQPQREARLAARRARVIKRIERWSGGLDAAQRAAVGPAIDALPDGAARWLAEHHARELQILEHIAKPSATDNKAYSGASSEDLLQMLEAWLGRSGEVSFTERQRRRAMRKRIIALVLTVDRVVASSQRAQVVESLNGYGQLALKEARRKAN